jgi:hypothetical protein
VDAVCYLFNLFKLFIYLFISFIYLCLLISWKFNDFLFFFCLTL